MSAVARGMRPMLNSVGDKIEPWGVPRLGRCRVGDCLLPSLRVAVRSDKKDLTRLKRFAPTFKLFNEDKIAEWEIRSKAFVRSMVRIADVS